MSECNTSCSCSTSTPVTKASEIRSKNKAIYRIENMDCPTEEALIRKKLVSVSGIESLDFNLMQRILTVGHNLNSLDAIESALGSIGMQAVLQSGQTSTKDSSTILKIKAELSHSSVVPAYQKQKQVTEKSCCSVEIKNEESLDTYEILKETGSQIPIDDGSSSVYSTQSLEDLSKDDLQTLLRIIKT